MNKKMLCERIMRGIQKSLNESFAFESDPVGDDILKVVSKNENIANVVKNASEEDWKELVNKMKELAQNSRVAELKMPSKITNVDFLAKAFLVKMDVNNVNLLKKMDETEVSGLVDYLNSDNADGEEQKSIGAGTDNQEVPFPMESKKPDVKEGCDGKGCKEGCETGKCDGTKEGIKESRISKRHARHLNESERHNKKNRRLNEMRSDNDQVLAEIYQHLCNCQDLAEEIGEFGLMRKMENMRTYVDQIRFRR